MINKIKKLMLVIATGSTLIAPGLGLAIGTAAAADAPAAEQGAQGISSNLCAGSNAVGSSAAPGEAPAGGEGTATCGNAGTGSNGESTISKLAKQLVNLFSLIVGIVSVIMIIYGGFRYITSGGESGKVGNAKNTIIYAIIGLVVVALAQIIVHFVLNTTATATTGVN